MYPSATLCRAQEAFQNDRARATTLENVRVVAMKAAKAWGKEAIVAEGREARGERVRRHKLLHLALIPGDGEISENPDRGLASL